MANLMNIQYGSKTYQLPKSLVTNEDFVKEIVSANVWNNKLRKSDKMNLLKFLPDFPNNDTHEKKETLKKLFLGKHINFENQIKTFVRLAKEGDFNPSIKPQKSLDLLLSERVRKISLLKRRLADLQRIIDVKKSLSIAISAEEEECMRQYAPLLTGDDPLSETVNLRFDKIMRKITGDPDEVKRADLYSSYLTNSSLDYKSLTLCDVINRCQNDQDANTTETAAAFSNGPMTRKRRQMQNGFDTSLNKYAKLNESSDSQSESSEDYRSNDDNSDDSVSSDTDSVGSALGPGATTNHNASTSTPNHNSSHRHGHGHGQNNLNNHTHKRVRLNRHERREFRCPTDDLPDFFSLLQRLFIGAHQHKLTSSQIEDRIRHWHIVHNRSINDSFNRWATLGLDWVSLAVPALSFLSSLDSPIVEHRKKSQLWRWRKSIDSSVLRKLFFDWHHSHQSPGSGSTGGLGGASTTRGPSATVGLISSPAGPASSAECEQIPPPLFQTDWRVRPSTMEERARFQLQERKRFGRPWRGFMYNVHGYNCVVGPIRGCLSGRDYSNVKARGHPLLVNERPPHVNIVEIVRDAVARLPNGEGSRADIVALAMDSAYWSGNASGMGSVTGSEKSISQCISSALDRLQGEGCDPSVKYNARLKLWFYRHRNKCVEELEQIHMQQQGQDEIRRYRGTGASSTVGIPLGGSSGAGVGGTRACLSGGPLQSPMLHYNHHQHPNVILSSTNSNHNSTGHPLHSTTLLGPAHPISSSRYGGQVQSYQQFSQAVNHARDLTLQPIFLSRPSSHHPGFHQSNNINNNNYNNTINNHHHIITSGTGGTSNISTTNQYHHPLFSSNSGGAPRILPLSSQHRQQPQDLSSVSTTQDYYSSSTSHHPSQQQQPHFYY